MPTSRAERWLALTSFARARWGGQLRSRGALESWQRARLARWLAHDLPRVRSYAGNTPERLDDLPIVDKARLLGSFEDYNVHGIELATALETARHDEIVDPSGSERGDDLAFGLSSGTGGARSVFITNGAERAKWMGILVARALPGKLLASLALGARPLRIALFLRANNRLYTTLTNRRIDFQFFALDRALNSHFPALIAAAPDVLVAPASVLAWFGRRRLEGCLDIQPKRVISVAEVLEPDDVTAIKHAFGLPVHQLYQCTEGFLGATCEAGTLHLNEDFVHVEREWLDAERTRFVPIVTDFTRMTQVVARFRLDDVLRVMVNGCRCGSPLLAIDRIEGRCDDVLWLSGRAGGDSKPIFPDTIRHAITRRADPIGEYRVVQYGDTFSLATENPGMFDALRTTLERVIESHELATPRWIHSAFDAHPADVKRRRIRCVSRN